MVTVLDVLRGSTDYLEKRGIESARLNSEHLLAHVLGVKRLDLYMAFDRPLGEAERAPMRELLKARGDGKPLQHLLGTAEFFGREFLCDARGLVPRPETEQLVEFVLARTPATRLRAVDVGTGSGVIGITLALERPEWSLTASDVSETALELAAVNAAKLSARLEFCRCDLLADGDEWDVIVANLPYIPAAEIATLSREVQCDPRLALDGGEDGKEIIVRLISSAAKALSPGGWLALEIGTGQSADLHGVLAAHDFHPIEALADYQGHLRFLIARHG